MLPNHHHTFKQDSKASNSKERGSSKYYVAGLAVPSVIRDLEPRSLTFFWPSPSWSRLPSSLTTSAPRSVPLCRSRHVRNYRSVTGRNRQIKRGNSKMLLLNTHKFAMSGTLVSKTSERTKQFAQKKGAKNILEWAFERDTQHTGAMIGSDLNSYEFIFQKLFPKGSESKSKSNHSLRVVRFDNLCFSNTPLLPARDHQNFFRYPLLAFSVEFVNYKRPMDCYLYLFSSIGDKETVQFAFQRGLNMLSRCENMTSLQFRIENCEVLYNSPSEAITPAMLGNFIRRCQRFPSTFVREIDFSGISDYLTQCHWDRVIRNCGDKVVLCIRANCPLFQFLSSNDQVQVKYIKYNGRCDDRFVGAISRVRLTHLFISWFLDGEAKVKVWDMVVRHGTMKGLTLSTYDRNDRAVVSSVIKHKKDLSIVRFDHGQEDFDDDFLPLLVANRIRTKLEANPHSTDKIWLKGLCAMKRCATERRDTLTPTYALLREKVTFLPFVMKGSIPSLMSQPGKKRRLV